LFVLVIVKSDAGEIAKSTMPVGRAVPMKCGANPNRVS